jgi:hypothetical protein
LQANTGACKNKNKNENYVSEKANMEDIKEEI